MRPNKLPFVGSQVRLSHWRIDARHSNSHTAWTAQGRPQDPSEAQLRAIKERQGLELLEPEREVAIRGGVLQLRIPFPLPRSSWSPTRTELASTSSVGSRVSASGK
jgi:hypothetical protein